MKETTVICYNGGSYGTYLEWCLTSLISEKLLPEPFNINGNSHKFKGNQLFTIDGWRQYICSNQQHQITRVHPKTDSKHSISENMCEILKNAKSLIYIYPNESSMLLNLNNFFFKTYDDWIEANFNRYQTIDANLIYDNWAVSKDIHISKIPTWIMREFLSYYLLPAWFDEIEWNHSKSWSHPKSITIFINDLLFDFENTILKIQKFCDLKFLHPVSALFNSHQKNLKLQKYLTQDMICTKIIDSIIHNYDFSWSTLPLPSEVWLQWELRNRGLEIKCNGLDLFPTNSVEFKKYLYTI